GALIPETTSPAAGATPIVSMATLKPLRVYAEVPQSLAPFIRNGDQATVTVVELPGREFKGSITRHPDALSVETRTMRVEVDLANEDLSLYPGMYAKARFVVQVAQGAPLVPDDALVFNHGDVFVPVVRGHKLRLVKVTLGYDNGETVEITSGVAPDDMVALNVGQAARDGENVQPVEAKAASTTR